MVYCFEYCSFFFLDDCCLDIETFEKRFFLAARFAAVLVGWGKGQEYEGCAPFAFQPLLFFAKSCYSSSSNSPTNRPDSRAFVDVPMQVRLG